MNALNKKLDKFFPFSIPAVIILGIFIGEPLTNLSAAVPYLFALVTFLGALKMSFGDMKATLRRPKPILLMLLILRLLMPLWALAVGYFLFPADELTRTGLLLFALIPVGINSALWTSLFGGNMALSLSVIIIDTLLSPFILPLSLLLFTGTSIEMDVLGMMGSLLGMIVIPSIGGMLANGFLKGELPKGLAPKFGIASKLGMVLIVLINGGNVASHFQVMDGMLLRIMAAIILLAVSAYSMSWFLAGAGKFNEADTVSIVFGGGMRNVSTGMVLAVAYFPVAVAVPIVASLLFQQMICAIFGQLMKVNQSRKAKFAKMMRKELEL